MCCAAPPLLTVENVNRSQEPPCHGRCLGGSEVPGTGDLSVVLIDPPQKHPQIENAVPTPTPTLAVLGSEVAWEFLVLMGEGRVTHGGTW